MSRLNALHAYETLLREFQARMGATHVLEDVLEDGLGFLMGRLNLQHASLFWWDEETQCLRMQYQLFNGTLMEGEETILIENTSPLCQLVQNREPVVVSKSNPWIAFLPLGSKNEFFGAVRFQRKLPLPRGAALAGLPPLEGPRPDHDRVYPLLEDISVILSSKVEAIFHDRKHLKKERYFRAGTEISTAVVEVPRLHEMLQSVSRSIVQNLGVDRVRIYLLEPSKMTLNGFSGIQIPGRVLSLEEEKFSLREGANPLVDAVMSVSRELILGPSGGRIVYIPLVVGRQIVGLMVVDNLLSQQDIDEEQLGALKTLAGQIGMAIVNAKLFEDIEQQAITDGLTKLYVYRYFQQRLKEEIDRADRYAYSVALVMMDVDNFKKFNDNYGHPLGDKVLEFLAQSIRGNIRRIDLAARYGGDEFVLLLPEISEREAWLMGTRLLNALKECTLRTSDGQLIPIAVTMGVALYPTDARNGRDLIECADKALYWAKRHSRGDICFYRQAPIPDKKEQNKQPPNAEKMA